MAHAMQLPRGTLPAPKHRLRPHDQRAARTVPMHRLPLRPPERMLNRPPHLQAAASGLRLLRRAPLPRQPHDQIALNRAVAVKLNQPPKAPPLGRRMPASAKPVAEPPKLRRGRLVRLLPQRLLTPAPRKPLAAKKIKTPATRRSKTARWTSTAARETSPAPLLFCRECSTSRPTPASTQCQTRGQCELLRRAVPARPTPSNRM